MKFVSLKKKFSNFSERISSKVLLTFMLAKKQSLSVLAKQFKRATSSVQLTGATAIAALSAINIAKMRPKDKATGTR